MLDSPGRRVGAPPEGLRLLWARRFGWRRPCSPDTTAHRVQG